MELREFIATTIREYLNEQQPTTKSDILRKAKTIKNSCEYMNCHYFSQKLLGYVDKKTDKIYALYQPFSLKWVLTGNFDDVYRANKTYVLLKEQSDKVVGLKEYLLENYTQYYK